MTGLMGRLTVAVAALVMLLGVACGGDKPSTDLPQEPAVATTERQADQQQTADADDTTTERQADQQQVAQTNADDTTTAEQLADAQNQANFAKTLLATVTAIAALPLSPEDQQMTLDALNASVAVRQSLLYANGGVSREQYRYANDTFSVRVFYYENGTPSSVDVNDTNGAYQIDAHINQDGSLNFIWRWGDTLPASELAATTAAIVAIPLSHQDQQTILNALNASTVLERSSYHDNGALHQEQYKYANGSESVFVMYELSGALIAVEAKAINGVSQLYVSVHEDGTLNFVTRRQPTGADAEQQATQQQTTTGANADETNTTTIRAGTRIDETALAEYTAAAAVAIARTQLSSSDQQMIVNALNASTDLVKRWGTYKYPDDTSSVSIEYYDNGMPSIIDVYDPSGDNAWLLYARINQDGSRDFIWRFGDTLPASEFVATVTAVAALPLSSQDQQTILNALNASTVLDRSSYHDNGALYQEQYKYANGSESVFVMYEPSGAPSFIKVGDLNGDDQLHIGVHENGDLWYSRSADDTNTNTTRD